MRIYYLYLLLVTFFFFACGKKSAPPSPIPTSNAVYISGFRGDDYLIAQNGKIIITPVIKRENEQTESGLEFQWIIDGNIVSVERNLEISIPFNISNGRKLCRYNVLDAQYDKLFSKEFYINITNPFGYGYYFLSVDGNFNSLLSHINIDKNSETVFHTSVIGDIPIGNSASSLNCTLLYDGQAERCYYKIYITSRYGEVPHIVTENISLSPLELIRSTHNGITFIPTMHIMGHHYESTSHFLNDGVYAIYRFGMLAQQVADNEKYKWGYITAGNNDKCIYAYNSLSGKYYVIMTDRDCKVERVEGDVNLLGEKIIGSVLRNYYGENGIIDDVAILTSKQGGVTQYNITDKSISRTWSGSIRGVAGCSTATIVKGCWYVASGNIVYIFDAVKKSVNPFITLEGGIGDINAIALNRTGEKLAISTFNNQSSYATKGSVVIVDIVSKKISTYYNTIYNCMGIICCDSKKL